MDFKYDIVLNTKTNKIGIPSEVYLSEKYNQGQLKKIYTLSEFNQEIENGAIVSDSTYNKIYNKKTSLFLEY